MEFLKKLKWQYLAAAIVSVAISFVLFAILSTLKPVSYLLDFFFSRLGEKSISVVSFIVLAILARFVFKFKREDACGIAFVKFCTDVATIFALIFLTIAIAVIFGVWTDNGSASTVIVPGVLLVPIIQTIIEFAIMAAVYYVALNVVLEKTESDGRKKSKK